MKFDPAAQNFFLTDKEARKLATQARRAGFLKPRPCRDCGQPDPRVLQMHHTDYSRPYAVIWLCRRCHAQEHSALVEELYKRSHYAGGSQKKSNPFRALRKR